MPTSAATGRRKVRREKSRVSLRKRGTLDGSTEPSQPTGRLQADDAAFFMGPVPPLAPT